MSTGFLLSPFTSFVITFGFFNLNAIAIELENPYGDDPGDLPLIETHENFVDALEEAFSAAPRLVNMRQKQAAPRPVDPGVQILNNDLGLWPGEERFDEVLSLECYELWTIDDLQQKFKNKTIAHEMHKKIRELLQDEADRKEAERVAEEEKLNPTSEIASPSSRGTPLKKMKTKGSPLRRVKTDLVDVRLDVDATPSKRRST
jgi:hypothetical protein